MSKKLFVGSLSWGVNDIQLAEAFSKCGVVEEAIVIKEKGTDRSKGFGFVTMANDADALKAIAELNDTELDGRNIAVSEAKPREEKA